MALHVRKSYYNKFLSRSEDSSVPITNINTQVLLLLLLLFDVCCCFKKNLNYFLLFNSIFAVEIVVIIDLIDFFV